MMRIHRRRLDWLVLPTALLAAACAAPTETEVSFEPGTPSPAPATDGGIVLLAGHRDEADAGEAAFLRCLEKELAKRVSHPLRLTDAAAFKDALFPWFEAETGPRTVEELNGLLARPQVRGRMASLGVRYVVVVASAERSDGFPGMACGAGYGGAGCLGVLWEDKVQSARAVVWDTAQGTEAGTLAATSAGTSVGFGLGIPILFIADTRDAACRALAGELARLLSGAPEAGSPGEGGGP